MKKVINKTVNLDLVGVNGNAYAIMHAFRTQARKERWPEQDIEAVITEAQSNNYNHLLATILNHCEPKNEIK